ncbi:MAG: formate dehydrogenase accessory sulfurtransferase FdhD [Chitinophagaceae bacterium]
MNQKGILKLKVKRFIEGEWIECDDLLVIEEPVEIRLQFGPMASQVQESISVTMRTPGNDKELALGFLFAEGIIQNFTDVKMVIKEASGPNTILVILKEDVKAILPQTRNFYTTSGCGVCGKASIEAITTISVFQDERKDLAVNKELFFTLKEQLISHQYMFESTGGIHASALFDINGRLIDVREDVGRHNALDKLIGAAFLEKKLPLSDHILLLSGRASFELVQKAYMAGIKIIAAIGAPSSLSVQLAERHNISLVGFLRDTRLNVYSGFERIR